MLFGSVQGGSISVYFSTIPQAIRSKIANEEDHYIANADEEELVEFYYNQFALAELEIDSARQPEIRRTSKTREHQDVFGDFVQTEVNYAEATLYLVPRINLELSLSLGASSFTVHAIEIDFNQSNSSITLNTPANGMQSDINFIKEEFKNRNPEIIDGNKNLSATISQIVKDRKVQVAEFEKEFDAVINSIDIPLQRSDIADRPIVDLKERKHIQELRKPLAKPKEEFKLDRKYVLDILEIIQNSGMQFELSPDVYGKLGEEDLRDIILSHLNTIFEGRATGETFSKQGKTDIHLNIAKGEIFIAECKRWKGEKLHLDTIDQLFRYLTWRRNFGLIINFADNKNFSVILATAEQSTQKHPTYKRKFTKLSDTHFQSVHTFPEDPEREIEIHHLFFNLFSMKDR